MALNEVYVGLVIYFPDETLVRASDGEDVHVDRLVGEIVDADQEGIRVWFPYTGRSLRFDPYQNLGDLFELATVHPDPHNVRPEDAEERWTTARYWCGDEWSWDLTRVIER